MSLVPFHPREGREVVLRHHNAIVVRDPSSQRLEIRGLQLTECPTCHQPLRSSSPERHFESPDHGENYVDPGYFRMLRAGHHGQAASPSRPPPSPVRRLVQPVSATTQDHVEDAEFVSSSPVPQAGSRIRREAFSPNYFNTFFIEERELGRGGKGVVLLVRHEIDGCHLGHFACKRVPVGDDHAWLEKVLVEVELLAKLSHPNLVSYRHVWLEDVKLNRFGPSVACAFILQQYCNGGDLQHYVIGDVPREVTKEELKAQMRRRSRGQTERPQVRRRLPPEEIYSLFKDVTSGLAYLHAANYIHRDLKPSNCLLHRQGTKLACLISDFGEVQPENVVRKSTGSTGTISYCAPEVLKKDASGRYGNFTTKSDVFSLGMILYFMCFGRLPYVSANAVNEELEDIDLLRAEITDWKGFQDERRERPDLPPKLYQLLKKLLSVNPAERPTAAEVLGAMGGSNLDGLMRSGPGNSSPPLVLGGRRIQNLDSPMPPGTPIPDPTKHARVTTSSDDDDDLPRSVDGTTGPDAAPASAQSTLLTKHIHPAPTRAAAALNRRAQPQRRQANHNHNHHNNNNHTSTSASTSTSTSHAMTLSRSQQQQQQQQSRRHYSQPHSASPEEEEEQRGPLSPAAGSPVAGITTPLLMPPPTTRLERARLRAALGLFRLSRWARANTPAARLLVFLAKVVSLWWVCWPFSARFGVLVGIVGMAVLDLDAVPLSGNAGSGSGAGLGLRLGEAGDDDGAGAGAGASGSGSGSGGGMGRDAVGARSRTGSGAGVTLAVADGSGTSRWLVGWRRSLVLLVLHCVMLGVTSRFGLGALCAVPAGREWLGL